MSILSRRTFTVMLPRNLPHREITRARLTPFDNIRAPRSFTAPVGSGDYIYDTREHMQILSRHSRRYFEIQSLPNPPSPQFSRRSYPPTASPLHHPYPVQRRVELRA